MPYPNVPGWMLALMLDADHHDKEALVAVAEGEIVGHAMCVRLGDGSEAEVAIIVEDRWQSKGVGKLLLSELAERARLRGIEFFTGEVLGQNRRMLGLVDAVFADSRTRSPMAPFVFERRYARSSRRTTYEPSDAPHRKSLGDSYEEKRHR
jgi:GNAT superfamily N-acetyltransferase